MFKNILLREIRNIKKKGSKMTNLLPGCDAAMATALNPENET